MTLSKEYRPRGNVIITGEDIIGGVSTLARNLSMRSFFMYGVDIFLVKFRYVS